MTPRDQKPQRRRLPAQSLRSRSRAKPTASLPPFHDQSLDSDHTQAISEKTILHSGSFCVPDLTDSEEEEIGNLEIATSTPYVLPKNTLFTFESNPGSTNRDNDNISTLGDSSSLFDTSPAAASVAKRQPAEAFKFGQSEPGVDFQPTFLPKMVVEREPPKATPQKPPQAAQPAINNVRQPEFGKPSPLQNRLQPSNVFNVPKPHQLRPEHHRPMTDAENSHLQSAKDIAHRIADPFRSHQPPRPRPDPDVVEIPRPTQAPTFNTYPRPPPTFSAFNAPTGGFSAVNAHQQPYIDLTKPSNQVSSDPALFDDRFGAADPYTYLDAGKAAENIKALLEGAFEDDEDKPRTRSRKKKVDVAVAGLADKLQDLEVKSNENKENLNGEAEEEQEEEEDDDGTVEGLEVKLLPHQVDGVFWMKDKEIGAKKVKGVLPKGGILADDMGLGKTIQSIALILTNPRPKISSASSVTDKKAISSVVGKNTLVVAPLALIKQWEAEIKNRVSKGHELKVCVHHGPQRTKRFEDLKKYDVVITTYQILVSEHGSSSDRADGPQAGCFGIHWYRVILDEAHTIKNRNAKATKACYALRSEYRWCLTGTPMQNNLDELQSLIRFLQIKPYNDILVWKDQITRPMSQGRGGVAIKRLQFYLKAFMKRRTKDVLKQEGALNPGGKSNKGGQSNGFKITARNIESIQGDFSPEERKFYDRLEQRTDKSLEQMMGGEKLNYASALVLLLRLRQACNHPQLVGGSIAKDRDALTTGQTATTQTPRKSKIPDNDIDEMADLLGGMSMQTKQCDICQIELTREEASAGSIRCAECEEDLASQATRKDKKKHRKHEKHHSSAGSKPDKLKSRIPKKRNVVLDDSDEEENAEWIVPDSQQNSLNLGKAGGSDDENAEGGGESLASSDYDTGDESEIKITGSRHRKIIDLDSSDEEIVKEEQSSGVSTDEEEDDDDSEEEASESDTESSLASITTSAKIQHLLKILHRETPTHKIIVFSQFTSMLDLIEPFLQRDGFIFTRYDGSMRNDHREASLERLRNNSKTRILLCSLKCGSLGLNLTAASRVVILEPFWNPFVEEQAIDRVHRLNQTQDVTVYKLTIAGTVEARILELQEKKRALANAAIEGKAVGKLSMKDIMNLFRHDAEHDTRHDDDPTLGTKTKVLTTGNSGATNGYSTANDRGSQGMRITPPAMEKPHGASKESSLYGRRW